MTSTPPAWKWLDECYVPVVKDSLTTDPRILPDTAPLHEQGDSPDPTGEDVWPLERERDCTAQLTDAQIDAVETHIAWVCFDCGKDRYGRLNTIVSTWHWDRCGICGRTKAVTEPRDFGGVDNLAHGDALVKVKCPVCRHEMESDEGVLCDHCEETIGPGSFAVVNGPGGVFVFHLRCYDEVYWGADDEDAQVMDRVVDKSSISGDNKGSSEPEPARSAIGAGPLFGIPLDDGVRFAHETLIKLPVDARNEHAPDDNPLLNHMERTFNSCMDTAVAKNEGYAGSADPMANFNDSVRLGVPVPIGVALRLSDKWARLCRLLQTGENPLADESITDTIMDAINYLAILLYALDNSVHS